MTCPLPTAASIVIAAIAMADDVTLDLMSYGAMLAKGNHAELAEFHPLGRIGEFSDVVNAGSISKTPHS